MLLAWVLILLGAGVGAWLLISDDPVDDSQVLGALMGAGTMVVTGCAALWRWARAASEEGGTGAPDESVSAAANPLGRPITDALDPFDLEVHRVIEARSDAREELPVLPPYVRRRHDERLAEAVAAAVAGESRMVVLIGESSTGKTRACWETVQHLRELAQSGATSAAMSQPAASRGMTRGGYGTLSRRSGHRLWWMGWSSHATMTQDWRRTR
jgi:hypothetical protein